MRLLKTFLAASIFAFSFLGGTVFGAQAALPSYGGTLVWGTTNPPTIINPILTNQGVSSAILSLIFDSLVRVSKSGEVLPALALSWDQSSDGLTYVFHLRPGVKFHDGVELTAKDVKFTYDAMADTKVLSPRKDELGVLKEASWEVVDKYTLKLALTRPSANVLFKLTCEIVPQHILVGQNMAELAFNVSPIGSGPFRFKAWDHQTKQIILEANRDYWQGRPYLDKIVVKVYPDNTSLWAGLMRQEVDFVKFLNREDYEVLKNDPAFKTYEIASGMSMAIVFDVKDDVFMDIRVRQAVARAIDVSRMIDQMKVGGIVSTGIFSSKVPGFNQNVLPLGYDPRAARQLLEDAGWRSVGGRSILEKDGMPLEMRMLVDERSGYFETASMIIRQRLAEIGVRLIAIPYKDEKEFTSDFIAHEKPQAWLRLFYIMDGDPGITLDQWYPSQDSFKKLWNYHNSQIDELIDRIKAVSDKSAREPLFQQVQSIIYDDQPACFLFSFVTRHAVARRFANTDSFFFPIMPSYLMKDWYLEDKTSEKK